MTTLVRCFLGRARSSVRWAAAVYGYAAAPSPWSWPAAAAPPRTPSRLCTAGAVERPHGATPRALGEHALDTSTEAPHGADDAGAPPASPANWGCAGDLQHVYAVHEFERQVYGRLIANVPDVERLVEYVATKPAAVILAHRARFFSACPRPSNMQWKDSPSRTNQSSATADSTARDTIECDLYLRKEGLVINELFRDCAEIVEPLTAASENWLSAQTSAAQPILLCEVAETPQVLRNKLWQLERTLRYGPPELLRHTNTVIVCLNGEQTKFHDAVTAARSALRGGLATSSIAQCNAYAVWTPYRNVYGEIGRLHADIDVASVKVDVASVKVDIAAVKADVKADIAAVKADVAAVKADVTSMKDALQLVIKHLGVK